MQLYKTYITDTQGLTHHNVTVSFQGSQTEASKARSAAKRAGHNAESQTIDVPTAKGPLLAWLNENVKA